MKLRYTVTRIRTERTPGVDELGNDVWVEDEFPTPVLVAGWSVPQTDEPKLAGHDRETVQVELIAAVGDFVPRDKVRLPGRDDVLHVVGESENYSYNPFGWDPGLEIVNLGGVR